MRSYAKTVHSHLIFLKNCVKFQSKPPQPLLICKISLCLIALPKVTQIVMNWDQTLIWFGILHFLPETPHLCASERPGNKRALFTDYREEKRSKGHIIFFRQGNLFANEKCYKCGRMGDKI